MTEVETFVTGIPEEKYECLWKICKFPLIQQTEQHLAAQQIEFEFGQPSTIWSKWQIFLHVCQSGTLDMCLKLLDKKDEAADLSVKGDIEYSKSDDAGSFSMLSQIETPLHLKINEQAIFYTSWCMKRKPSYWDSTCNDEGTLYLKVKLSVLASKPVAVQSVEKAYRTFNSESVKILQQSFAEMGYQDEFADLTITCKNGRPLKAHKAVLAARNPVFQAMLRSDMRERNSDSLEVDDISQATMTILLHYLYTGILLSDFQTSELIHEFTYAAGKYQLTDVLNLLDELLGTEQIPVYDVKLLSLANKLQLKKAASRLTGKVVKTVSRVNDDEELLALFGMMPTK